MSYYANGNGTIQFKTQLDRNALNDFLSNKDINFEYFFEDYWYDDSVRGLVVHCYDNYHEPNEVLDKLSEYFPTEDGSSIEYDGEDDSHWRFRYSEKDHRWIEDNGTVVYDNNKEESIDNLRTINFYDCDSNLLIKTNAPEEVIREAIRHRDNCLEKDIPMFSDFETIQEYIWNKNPEYVFEEIGYVEDIESYEW